MTIEPQTVNKMLPTAYGTVYPSTGALLFAFSQIAPIAAVVVNAPAVAPSVMGALNLKTYFPNKIPANVGMIVTMTPAQKKLIPDVFNPETKPGPALIPTTATNAASPTLLKNQAVLEGIRPMVGRRE